MIPFSTSSETRSSSFKSFVNDNEIASDEDIVHTRMTGGKEWIEEDLESLGMELALYDEFFREPEVQRNISLHFRLTERR